MSSIRAMSAVEAVGGIPRLVLKGAPGSGKSTFAKHLCLCMIGELRESTELGLATLNGTDPSGNPWPANIRPWHLAPHFPLYVECRHYVRSRQFRSESDDSDVLPLLQYLTRAVEGCEDGADTSPSVADAMQRLLRSGPLCQDELRQVEGRI